MNSDLTQINLKCQFPEAKQHSKILNNFHSFWFYPSDTGETLETELSLEEEQKEIVHFKNTVRL